MIKINSFIIRETLPTLNEVTKVERSNRYAAAKLRKQTESLIGEYIRHYRQLGALWSVFNPVDVVIIHHEKDRRKDADNLQIRAKFILDALVREKILYDDNRKNVRNVYQVVKDSEDGTDIVEVMLIDAGLVKVTICADERTIVKQI